MTDLSVVQIGRSIRLTFTLPRNATDGERLTKSQEVEILREIVPPGSSGPVSDANMGPWLTLSNEEVEKQKLGITGVLTFSLAESERPSTRIRFGLRTLTRGFRSRPLRSALSNIATLTLLEVSDAPQGLKAVTTQEAIVVSWNAPPIPVAGYRVFRRVPGQGDSFRLIAETTEPAYRDSSFEFGQPVAYKVSAIVKDGKSTAASEDSLPVEIIPRDTFPPKPPHALTALYTTQVVELIWSANFEADLRGYTVYRRTEGRSQIKLTPEPLITPIFRDADVTTGKLYTYRVTATDSEGNESDYSEEATAEVR